MRRHAFIIFLATILSIASLGIIVVKFNPVESGYLIKSLFFSASLASLLGLGTFLAGVLDIGFSKFFNKRREGNLLVYLRGGLLLSLGSSVFILLNLFSFLNIITGIIVATFFIGIELIFRYPKS